MQSSGMKSRGAEKTHDQKDSRSLPNEASIMRLVGAVLFEQKDEWQTQNRYMMVEAFAKIDTEETDPILSITTQAA